MDKLVRKMTVRYSCIRNFLCGILYNNYSGIHHRIVVRDIYGKDHEIFNKVRLLTKVPNDRHVYHMRYSIKVPEAINFLRLERYDDKTNEWVAISGIDFMGDYSRGTFIPGRYTLFDSFRWHDLFQDD